ncbi:MAG TPA: hypothetical protein DEG17_27355 [Cyanobacteria bacterium UBA11149]|nr:hypothetical protein [Cyanobacteria bacterium UBA11367]HBE57598.1 hypothetical protein [Cyanobacteria bacterium UBA11366]HBK63066.1 hypothetical protein [Cyanobacteria bacterium UBA11166]HBR77050.1 hypothetical protein [Cyanobacteria bacterium UBA11159]HBS71993.1 hypothetical protein [Cyanobacteria bacterium UBA11153]HBW92479.1 hypothetical protein [Cyanobacteria bacterium UBA11149]HCA96430.1 hypothetical protein [Cyanobacteria bacterium UBA9226]
MSELVKAKLKGLEGAEDIEFMFNPNQLAFSRSMSLEQSEGARTEQGLNKTSFKHPNPYSLKISGIPIDTYETGESAMSHVNKFKKAVEFADKGEGQKKRPPIYLFTWGQEKYICCFVKTLSYKLTMFLPNGTPVRATVDLDLEEIDYTIPQPGVSAGNPSESQRARDTRAARATP